MSVPVTTILEVWPKEGYDPQHIIVRFQGKQHRIEKVVGFGFRVYTKKGRGYTLLKTSVGEGIFKDLLKKVEGLRLPPGYKQ